MLVSKMKSVDIIRADMFMKKNKRENKVIDLPTMPPSFSSLFLHLQHADYVARIWKLTLSASLSLPDITGLGWDEDGRIKWIQKPFSDDITELLIFDNAIEDDSGNMF